MAKRVIFLAIAVLCLLALIFCFNPITFPLYPPCIFHHITGLYCPGCGSTRAIHALLHGDLLGALRFNPLTLLFIFILASYGIVYAIYLIKGKSFNASFINPVWIWLLLAVILLFWVLRNIPFYPFTLLVPRLPQ